MTLTKKINLKKWHKVILILFAILMLTLIFLPSVIKSYIEKNSIELIGRQVSIEEIKVNYFKLSVRVTGFKMYEVNQKDEFIAFDEFYLDYHLWPIFQNEIAISDINLINPVIHIEFKSDSTFNFSDLIKPEELEEEFEEELAEIAEEDSVFNLLPYRVDVNNLDIQDGAIYVDEQIKMQQLEWQDLNLVVPNIAWDNSQSNAEFDVKLGPTGKLTFTTEIDPSSGEFDFGLNLQTINLSFFKPYVADFLRVGDFEAIFNLDLDLRGNANDIESANLGGHLLVTDIDIEEPGDLELLSIEAFDMDMERISLRDSVVLLNSIHIEKPFINATLLKDGGTNFERLLSPLLAIDTPAVDVPDTISTKTNSSAYSLFEVQLDSFEIVGARLELHDSTITIPFNYVVSDFNFSTYGLDNRLKELPIDVSAVLNNNGRFTGQGLLNPSNPMDIEFEGHIDEMQLVPFTNYSLEYIARPIERGTYFYDMSLDMTDSTLVSKNRIRFEQIRFGDRIAGQDKKIQIPIKTAIYMVEDPDGFADFDVDVKGNPSDPNFKVWPIVWQTLSNTFLKIALEPFNFLSKTLGVDPEKIKTIDLTFLQDSLNAENMTSLNTLIEIQERKKDLKFGLVLITNRQLEKEALAVMKMKELFLVEEKKVAADSTKNYLGQVQTEEFEAYINQRAGMVIQNPGQYCYSVLRSSVDAQFDDLLVRRIQMVQDYFSVNAEADFEYLVRIASINRMRTEKPESPYFEVIVSTKGEEFITKDQEKD